MWSCSTSTRSSLRSIVAPRMQSCEGFNFRERRTFPLVSASAGALFAVSCTPMGEAVMGTRENSIATWCKRFQIDLWKLLDRMKSGELTVFEKRADGKVDITAAAMVKLKELIAQIEGALLDE